MVCLLRRTFDPLGSCFYSLLAEPGQSLVFLSSFPTDDTISAECSAPRVRSTARWPRSFRLLARAHMPTLMCSGDSLLSRGICLHCAVFCPVLQLPQPQLFLQHPAMPSKVPDFFFSVLEALIGQLAYNHRLPLFLTCLESHPCLVSSILYETPSNTVLLDIVSCVLVDLSGKIYLVPVGQKQKLTTFKL